MKTITLTNTKGGVGKTTNAVHIAAGLAMQGKRVCLIDADPQAHATVTLGLQKAPHLHDLLLRGANWEDMLSIPDLNHWTSPDTSPQGELYMVAGDIETRSIPMMTDDITVVLNRLIEVSEFFDVIIIDTSPTPSMLHGAIYLASDYLVYPTQCEKLSIEGLQNSFAQRQKTNASRHVLGLGEIQIAGIIPTMYRKSTSLHNYNVEALQQAFGSIVWQPLSLRTAWADAMQLDQTVFASNADQIAIQQAWGLIKKVREFIA